MASGVVCTKYIDVDIPVLGTFLFIGTILMYISYRRKTSIVPLLYLNSFLIGLWYGGLYSEIVTGTEVRTNRYGTGSERLRCTESVLSIEKILLETNVSGRHCSVLNAMVLGDRSGLDTSQKALFRQGGAQHLLALSGLHIGIFLTLLNLLFLRRAMFSAWKWPVLLVSLSLLWCYAVMVGLPKSLLRAMLMTSIFLIGEYLSRPDSGSNVLAMTILAMMAVDPLCVFDVGAQLSVSAMVGLVFFSPTLRIPTKHWINKYYGSRMRRNRVRNLWLDVARRVSLFMRGVLVLFWVSFSASIFTAPLVLYYFHQFQPWQAIMSVLLIPLTSVIMYLALSVILVYAIGLQSVAVSLSSVLDGMMDLQENVLGFSASLPYSSMVRYDVSMLQVVLLFALLFSLFLALRSRTWRSLSYSAGLCSVLSLLLLFL